MLCGKYRYRVAWPEVSSVLNMAITTRTFIIAIVVGISAGLEAYFFTICAAEVTRKLRILSLRAVLRQDSEFLHGAS